ncbi:MAG: calcium-binding protein [Myxococcota bacterium]
MAPPEGGVDARTERQRLAPLQSPCVFVAASGSLSIVLAPGEVGFLERRAADSALLINGDVCNSAGGVAPFAKSTTATTATITGSAAGGETMVLDFLNGPFLRGTAATPGLVLDLAGGGTDEVQLRLTGARDVVRAGVNGWDVTGDGTRDVTLANVSHVTVTLGDGDDVFSALGGGTLGAPVALDVTGYGGPGDDSLTGGSGDDTLFGDTGADVLSGGTSASDADTLSGGAGTDTVSYATRSAGVTVTVGAGSNDGEAGEQDDVQADVETVIGGAGADTFTGTSGAQTFSGGAGDDTFRMGLLASTGAGADTVFGEAGVDTVDYGARLEAVTVTMDFNVANDGNTASGEGDNVRADVERLICPTAAVSCTVTGNALNNVLVTGGGVDTLDGAAGDDVFVVTSGGADRLVGGAGIDRVDFSTYGATIDVRMDDVPSTTEGKRIAADVEDLVCPTASACTVLGNALNNHLEGSSQLDHLSSAGGDDLVETNGGVDVVDCGDGSDILFGSGAAPVGTTCEL